MTEVVIVYYSAFGHIATLSEAIAKGVERVEGVRYKLVRIPEFNDPSIRVVNQRSNQKEEGLGQHFKLTKRVEDYDRVQEEQASIPIAAMEDLRLADGIIWGFPTYLGSMPAQVKSFLDQAGQFCTTGDLEGKPTALFTSAGSIHGGHEATLLSSLVPLLHLGMLFVGLPYTENPEYLTDQAIGCSPYGVSTLAGPDGSRIPVEEELTMASRLGERVARIAKAFTVAKPFDK
ncbi:NAD(P)H:quinone oxidoreductase [Halalkalibacter krulwichiae]|uniref:p-benzoquinone reductase n=1 Tax=Halalkalibacter krulwichiae TaxID=199441 RepID=A0A1X9MF21_9BACI|nr:NAD(P)H:quinone oxidoreductase [Halalkalibacter krulwichiae]ARK32016.1 p-benzoquinone reductase [Halalkalibacter krulwichiae]